VPEEEGLPVQTHPFLCSKEGVALIKKDIDEKEKFMECVNKYKENYF
jgi:quinone-modifying oxidoreductase subunit QmoB